MVVKALSWFVRGGMALILTLANTAGMTPFWLCKGISLWSKDVRKSPNPLQWYLTFSARAFLYWLAKLRAQPNLNTRTPSRFRDWILCRKFSWIEPVPLKKLSKQTTKTNNEYVFDDEKLPINLNVKESKMKSAGLWYLNPREPFQAGQLEKKKRKSEVLLYFHGGAYITLEAGDIFVGLTLARFQARFGQMDVFSINYRLAPSSKYPSQLYEAYSAWVHLRKMGYEQILIGGDSAGANLALTLWRYLDEIAKDSKAVKGLILHSPWLDMDGHSTPEFKKNLHSCAITSEYVQLGFKALQTANVPTADDPWISPIRWNKQTLSHLPPVFITDGGAETLLAEAKKFVRNIRSIEGKDVHHHIVPYHPHDFSAMPWFYSSTKAMHTAAGQWVRRK